MGDSVQSVIFDRNRWTNHNARSWLATHGFVASGKMHDTEHYLRYRQRDPRVWERYVTKSLANYPGVKLIVAVKGLAVRPVGAYSTQ